MKEPEIEELEKLRDRVKAMPGRRGSSHVEVDAKIEADIQIARLLVQIRDVLEKVLATSEKT